MTGGRQAALDGIVLLGESRLFQLDFGWIDFAFSVLFYALLVHRRKWLVLKAGNCFGAFAFFADYCWYYQTKGTRTMEYPAGDTPMTPTEDFFFFFWFDWINGADIVMWALLVCEGLFVADRAAAAARLQRTRLDWAMLAMVPLWFWATPALSWAVDVDNRTVLASRPSEKGKYWVLMVVFVVLLRVVCRLRLADLGRALAAGVGCGLIHHAPLFAHGMRGYSSPKALAVTLLTEWPAIMLGLLFITRILTVGVGEGSTRATDTAGTRRGGGGGGKGRKRHAGPSTQHGGGATAALVVAAAFAGILAVALVAPPVPSTADILYEVMPYIPATVFTQLGVAYLRVATCVVPEWVGRSAGALECFPPGVQDATLLVSTAAPKGGAVLFSRMAVDVGMACGLCVGAGSRTHGEWPPDRETAPAFETEALLAAANMRVWDAYAREHGRTPRCVTLVRDPGERLRSLVFYARAGREQWFKATNVTATLTAFGDAGADAAVAFLLDAFGRRYLEESHDYLVESLRKGCRPIRFRQLLGDYNASARAILSAWGIEPAHHDALVDVLQARSPQRAADRNDHHVTTNLFPAAYKRDVTRAIDRLVGPRLAAMRAELDAFDYL